MRGVCALRALVYILVYVQCTYKTKKEKEEMQKKKTGKRENNVKESFCVLELCQNLYRTLQRTEERKKKKEDIHEHTSISQH